MKYIVVLSCLVLSLSALADERFAGSWSWAGNECRDSSLSAASRYSVSTSRLNIEEDVSSAEIVMNSAGSVTFRVGNPERGEVMEERGTYTVTGNEVDAGNDTGGFKGLLEGSCLVITFRSGDDDQDDWDGICNSGERFAFVFCRTDQ